MTTLATPILESPVALFMCAHEGCNARLHPVPCGDEFTYVDEQGSSFSSDNLHEQLDSVEAAIARYQARGVTAPSALWNARHMLNYRMNFGTWGHQHRPDRSRLTGPKIDIDVPEHCAWPMRLTPTGWACRQCTHREAADGLAILTGRAA